MKSIRWQLPFSYAAIALLAALALGALMLWRLDEYYTQREIATMRLSAQSIQLSLQTSNLDALSADVLQAQVNGFAFLARSRVRLYGEDGSLLADSGEFDAPDNVVAFTSFPAGVAFSSEAASSGDVLFLQAQAVPSFGVYQGDLSDGTSTAEVPWQTPAVISSDTAQATESRTIVYSVGEGTIGVLPVFTLVTASGLSGWEEAAGMRSRHSVELPLQIGGATGELVVSGGPAYGRQIVNSVAQAWALAGLLAVAVAAAVGWLASRRITQPVLALAAVTERMAGGDLSARAGDLPGLEFGTLGRAFDHMAQRVESTVLALRRFAADAAHELRTPLTALRTDLELAEGESNRARLAALIERANAQVRELEQLTAGLLDLSRLETAQAEMEMERLDLTALAQQVCEAYATRAEQAGQTFELALPAAPVFVHGNPARLALALGNLLENALKFTPADGVVRLRLEQTGDVVQVAVEDSGAGIPEEDLPLIFERFHRGRNAASYPGSGLGLAIVRAVAEAHGGSAHAANRAEGGAKVWIELPVVR